MCPEWRRHRHKVANKLKHYLSSQIANVAASVWLTLLTKKATVRIYLREHNYNYIIKFIILFILGVLFRKHSILELLSLTISNDFCTKYH